MGENGERQILKLMIGPCLREGLLRQVLGSPVSSAG
jgi:hypothetical protein